MDIKLLQSAFKKKRTSAPKAVVLSPAKSAYLRALMPLPGVQHCPPHYPLQPGPRGRKPGPVQGAPGAALGRPLSIDEAASLIGCSPWTVRQTLIPRGLPHLRFTASGKLIFYTDQIIRWIEIQQEGGNTTK
jgi:hypothetical protein